MIIVSQCFSARGSRVQHIRVHRSVFFLSVLPNPSFVITATNTVVCTADLYVGLMNVLTV